MLKLALSLALLSASSAFSPALSSRTGFSLRSDAATDSAETVEAATPARSKPTIPGGFCRGYVGGEGPEPMPLSPGGTSVNFDPVGFSERAPEWVPWFREAELKHGRAAMLANVGLLVPQFLRIPGEQFSFENVPDVINAHDALPNSMLLILAGISLLEACTIPALANMDGYDRRPGDFGFDPLGLYPKDEKLAKERQLQELKNGRIAMIAIGGQITQAAIVGGAHFPYV